jgi:molybdopterin converting factor small subunit
MPRVKIVYSGIIGEIIGKSIEYIDTAREVKVEELIEILVEKYSVLREWLSKIPIILVQVNGVDSTNSTIIHDGDEVAIYTPLYEGG